MGSDQSVLIGEMVTINGTATDDGILRKITWTQLDGPPVSLNTTGAQASFTAPTISGTQALTFKLEAIDEWGGLASDEVSVTVWDGTTPQDSTAPVTTYTGTRRASKGSVSFDITLSSNEPGTTYFRFSGQGSIGSGGTGTPDWQPYTNPVTINLDKKGVVTFEYYSIDDAGNQEATQQEVLQ
ncbi:PKD domain-containing protein [Gilvimarinus sp. F26214L]|uniref:PKD domain-containing protein n=1 Tax=Gilvimarinus sp. DZF01 TaxID=3461371 RepID=UPI0040460C51